MQPSDVGARTFDEVGAVFQKVPDRPIETLQRDTARTGRGGASRDCDPRRIHGPSTDNVLLAGQFLVTVTDAEPVLPAASWARTWIEAVVDVVVVVLPLFPPLVVVPPVFQAKESVPP